MRQLDLDPPSSGPLRLVSSRSRASGQSRDLRYRSEISLGAEARSVHRLTLAWALRQGVGIDPDAVRVVLATRQHYQSGPFTSFCADDIWGLLMIDIVSWCQARGLTPPPECAQAVRLIVNALADGGRLHADSCDLADLEHAVDECTGGW